MIWLEALPFVGKTIGRLFGNKEKREEYSAQANSAIHAQYAAEFRANRNWFDSLVDGINRLPRPTIVFGIIYLFVLCWNEPEKFAEGAANLDLIPPEMWAILSVVVVFYFGDRTLKHLGKRKHHREAMARLHERKEAPRRREVTAEREDPQEPIAWQDRVERRYDWSNLND